MKDIIFQLDIPDMACLELSDGMSLLFLHSGCLYFFLPVIALFLLSSPCFLLKSKSKTTNSLSHPYSAEAVASMIIAHIFDKSWHPPVWLPKRYLTWATEE